MTTHTGNAYTVQQLKRNTLHLSGVTRAHAPSAPSSARPARSARTMRTQKTPPHQSPPGPHTQQYQPSIQPLSRPSHPSPQRATVNTNFTGSQRIRQKAFPAKKALILPYPLVPGHFMFQITWSSTSHTATHRPPTSLSWRGCFHHRIRHPRRVKLPRDAILGRHIVLSSLVHQGSYVRWFNKCTTSAA